MTVVNHALRNAWLPVVTMVGLEFGFLLGGVVVIDSRRPEEWRIICAMGETAP